MRAGVFRNILCDLFQTAMQNIRRQNAEGPLHIYRFIRRGGTGPAPHGASAGGEGRGVNRGSRGLWGWDRNVAAQPGGVCAGIILIIRLSLPKQIIREEQTEKGKCLQT